MIQDIIKTFTEEQKTEIFNRIALEGKIGLSSIYRWFNGKVKPTFLYKQLIITSIKEVTGREYTAEQLWS